MLEGGRKPTCDQDPALMQSIRSAASERGTGNLLSFKNPPPITIQSLTAMGRRRCTYKAQEPGACMRLRLAGKTLPAPTTKLAQRNKQQIPRAKGGAGLVEIPLVVQL